MAWVGLALAAALSGVTGAPSDRVLTSQGFGHVRTGMSLKQAEQALGSGLRLDTSQDPSGHCVYAYRADGSDPGVGYMLIGGKIERVDVELKDALPVRTSNGLGQGASVEAVKQAYGSKAKQDPTDYAEPGDLVVKDPGGKRGVRFSFQDGKLAWLIAGNYPALSFSEGCL
jgi:hypothetical protein